MAQTGRILRFDETRGYGFIIPDKGGDDVFVHANEFCDVKELFTVGTPVEFEVVESDRGLKAFAVHIVEPKDPLGPSALAQASRVTTTTGLPTQAQLAHEFTDLLLQKVPELTGAQISQLRRVVMQLAENYGWIGEMT